MSSNKNKITSFQSLRQSHVTNSVRADGLHKFVLCQSRFDVGADRFLRLNPPGTSIAQAKNPKRRVIKVWRMKLLVERGDELIIDKRETAKRKDMRMIQGVNINHIGTFYDMRFSRQ